MYFGLLPLLIHVLIVTIMDIFCKYNLRLMNSLMIVHQAIAGIGLIINGIMFDSENDDIVNKYNGFYTNCVINDSATCSDLFYSSFRTQKFTNGISSTFTFFMGFILVLQVLCIIGILVVNIVIIKYYKLR